ncbi:hypothetical protein Lalb_Chr10g0106951 [Lupinus albus]|uniref:Transmembrane protein n=1 Tax=Lupinus albus TaxID=3870 RepID=A0A6A4PXQ1_LUPAL|nr:hypothetical protein Lalb_Chr10g0106951 [Lupinus albus]
MADFAAPSFSLGFDLSHHFPPLSPSPDHYHHRQDVDLPPQVPDSDPETGPDPPRRILKQSCFDDDDDIQEFSSQDDDVDDVVQGGNTKHINISPNLRLFNFLTLIFFILILFTIQFYAVITLTPSLVYTQTRGC